VTNADDGRELARLAWVARIPHPCRRIARFRVQHGIGAYPNVITDVHPVRTKDTTGQLNREVARIVSETRQGFALPPLNPTDKCDCDPFDGRTQ
jgi:hypothetical protein